MIWTKCNHEFWWTWLQYYQNYKHAEAAPCYFRKLIQAIFLAVLFININFTISYKFPHLWNFQYKIYEWMVYIIMPNVLLLVTPMEILLVSILQDWIKPDANIIQKSMKYPMLGLAVLYPTVYFSLVYYIAISENWSFIIIMLAYEVWILICLSFFIFSIYASILFVAYIILFPLIKVSKYLLIKTHSKGMIVDNILITTRFFFWGWSPILHQNKNKPSLK